MQRRFAVDLVRRAEMRPWPSEIADSIRILGRIGTLPGALVASCWPLVRVWHPAGVTSECGHGAKPKPARKRARAVRCEHEDPTPKTYGAIIVSYLEVQVCFPPRLRRDNEVYSKYSMIFQNKTKTCADKR